MAFDIKKLEAEYGEVKLVSTAAGPVVVKTPSEVDFDRYMATMADDKRKHLMLKELAICSVVYPSLEEYKKMVSKKPGIAIPVGSAAEKLAGTSEVESGKG